MDVGDARESMIYTPLIAPVYWDDVRDFVEKAVTAVRGRTPYSEAELSLSVGRLAVWCWHTVGLDLKEELVFHRSSIDRFARSGLTDFNEAARGNIRSQLLRVAEVLLDSTLAPPRLTPMRAADPSQPYLEREVVALQGWAESQSTPARRTNAQVLLALGLGAGLSASEIGNLRVGNIEAALTGVDVNVVVGRARRVPVLAAWAGALVGRTQDLPPESFAFREAHTTASENLISNFVRRSRSEGTVPQSQRMRATWIVHHLQSGVPVVALLRAAGVDSLDALNRYVRFVSGPAPLVSEAMMRH